jgi:protein O-mannosyl-transferase
MANKLFEIWNVREKRFHLISVTLIIILTAIVYANTLDNEFTNWDDDKLILNNTLIRSLEFDNLKKIFDLKSGGTYQPMRVFSYALDYRIGKFDPFVFHLHNIILHVFSSILLYMLLLTILPRIERGSFGNTVFFARLPDLMRILALFTALLFALHPVNVEAVTWLSSRKYVLLSFFSFASLLCYMQRPVSKKIDFVFYMLSVFFWILAAMSSPFGVILPALFVLLEYCTHPDKNPYYCLKDNLVRLSFYIILGLVVLVYLMTTLGAVSRIESSSVPVFNTMMQVFWDYMRNFVAPFWLNNRYVDYVYPSIFSYYKVAGGLLLLFGAVAASIHSVIKKNGKLFFFALFWFLICWLPASNIVPISTRMADRYIYLGSVGFFIFFSWSLCYFFNILSLKIKVGKGREMMVFIYSISLIVISVSILSVVRNDVWQNSGTLWKNSLKRDPKNIIALNNRGMWLFKKGRVKEAKKHFLFANFTKPTDTLPLYNLGFLYYKAGDWLKAKHAYEKILEIAPDSMLAHRASWECLNRLGRGDEAGKHIDFVLSEEPSDLFALNQKGLILYESGKYKQAEDLYRKSIEKFSDNPEFHFNLGMTLQKTGRMDEAMESFDRAAEIKPDYALAYHGMGQILFYKKDYKGAIREYDKALELNAGLAEIHNDMGNVFFEKNDFDKAKEYYTSALELNDQIYEAFFNQCVILEKKGSLQKAIKCYENCMEKFKNHPESMNNAGSLLIKLERFEEAEKYFLKAIEIDNTFLNAHYNLIELYKKTGKSEKALDQYQNVAEFNPDDLEVRHEICALLGDSGKLDKSEQCYKKILSDDPKRALDHFQLGIVLLRKGLETEAGKHFKKALEIDPDNPYFKHFISKGVEATEK